MMTNLIIQLAQNAAGWILLDLGCLLSGGQWSFHGAGVRRELAGKNVILSWPTGTESGFSLESAADLNTPTWVSAGTATVVGGQNVVPMPCCPMPNSIT